jgi:5-methylthioadenosine/S-adenosylhomocysteine deaminase
MRDSTDVLLRDGLVVPVDGEEQPLRGDVWIREGRIEAVGDIADDAARDGRMIDLEGRAVVPGFVQPHIHLCQTLLRSAADDMALIDWLGERVWPYEDTLRPEQLHASARLGIAELLLGGTTAILDMGTVRHTDAIGSAVEESGIRAFIGKCMMDLGDEDVPDGLIEETSGSLQESVRLCRRWDGEADGRVRYAFAPRFAVSCTEQLLRETAEAAEDLGVPVHTHASETRFENEFALERHGMRNIPFLEEVGLCRDSNVFAHGVHVDDDERRLLADRQTAICHCPSSNLKLASGVADIPRHDAFGVELALGADGAPCNNNLDAFREMRLAALIHKPNSGPEAMPARRVLELATIDGARALGIDDEVGSIEPGKAADLTVLDLESHPGTAPGGDPYSRIVYAAQRHNVDHVFVRGRQLVRDGELACADLEEILAEARSARDVVFGRIAE